MKPGPATASAPIARVVGARLLAGNRDDALRRDVVAQATLGTGKHLETLDQFAACG